MDLPMTTDRLYNAQSQLISPPPEETLRRLTKHPQSSPALSNAKRKRSHLAVATSNDSAVDPQPLATPNPRSRKQPKQQSHTPSHSTAYNVPMDSPTRSKSHPPESLSPFRSPTKPKCVVVQSPHVDNPNADYIPPVPLSALSPEDPKRRRSVLGARSSRRSATPIPPYEPPTDIFTPPKEVFATPVTATIRISKSSKRKSAKPTTSKKKKSTPAPVTVKLEMPDVDLNAPMPPPSPGDDPLLLSSSVEPPSSTPTRPRTRHDWMPFSESNVLEHDKDTGATGAGRASRRTTSPVPSLFTKLRFDDLPPSSPPDEHSDQPSPIVDDSADLDTTPVHMPFFDLADNANDNGWSDSEGDELPMLSRPAGSPAQEGEGEYTGKYKEVLVKVKADPPSSATRCRMDEWGNPKSPFPLSLEKKPSLQLVQEDEERLSSDDEKEEEEVRRMSVEPEAEVERADNPFDFGRVEPLPEEQIEAGENVDGQDQQVETADYVVPLRGDGEGSPRPGTPVRVETEINDDHIEEGPSAEDAFKLMGNHSVVEDVDVEVEDEEPPAEADAMDSDHRQEEEEPPAETDAMDSDHDHKESQPVAETEGEEPLAVNQAEAEPVDSVPVANDEEDSSSSDADDPDIVKITSADPRAAARAAAILRQHNYDCFTKIELKRRHSETVRRRSASPFELQREKNLKGVSTAGVRKEYGRRKTIGSGMGVRGEDVFIPGSPMTTLPKLLKEAEAEVSMEHSMASPNPFALRSFNTSFDGNAFKTPLPARTSSPFNMVLTPKVPMTPGEMCYDPLTGERMWTKEEWKRLDACFTDERLEVGARLGYKTELVSEDGLANVDLVQIEDVVRRFVEWMGGEEAVDGYGPAWSRENLLQRTRALQNKQRSGHVAPPTTLPFSPSPGQMRSPASPFNFGFDNLRRASMEVPDFTPIRQRPVMPKRQWTSLIPPSTDMEVSSTPLPRQQTAAVVTSTKPVPATLLAPRYSHLLEEALKVSKDLPEVVQAGDDVGDSQDSDTMLEEPESEDSPTTLVEEESVITELEVHEPPEQESKPEPQPEPTTIGKRVKGLIFSYLPTLKKPAASDNKCNSRRPGLPLPPKEVLEKPRGPVVTPAREPLPKPVHPKELVRLHEAPPIPPPASKIPRVVPPKQLVELHHVTPKVADGEKGKMRARRSSGTSVKDLIKGFEEMESQSRVEGEARVQKKGEVRRMKSVGEWRKGVSGLGAGKVGELARPTWKP